MNISGRYVASQCFHGMAIGANISNTVALKKCFFLCFAVQRLSASPTVSNNAGFILPGAPFSNVD